MSLKYQHTTADFLPWYAFEKLLLLLERDKEYKFLLLISSGVYFALRISDLLRLRWRDILDKEEIVIIEKKTEKKRVIPVIKKHKEIINRVFKYQNKPNLDTFVFSGKDPFKPLTIQYINRKLKKLKLKYKLPIKNFSSHTFRKTFGRHVWESSQYSEKSLILLSELFGHSSPAYTKRYLGIRGDEIKDLYRLLDEN